jgi:hypothetical protein
MAQPTALEQEMLELVNRMRQNPAGELSLLINSDDPGVNNAIAYFDVDLEVLAQQWSSLTPVAPLAWSSEINDAARFHNQKMIETDTQSHQLPGEPSVGERVTNASYQWATIGENVYAYAQSVFDAHAAFAIDWGNEPNGIQDPPGHRNNIMNADFREVGIGNTPENNSATDVGPLVVTQDFGNSQALKWDGDNEGWLLGVAYLDLDGDSFYDAGEGLNDVSVNVNGINGTNFNQTVNTWSAGGYQILLEPGDYQLTFVRNNEVVRFDTARINSENVKVDLILNSNTDDRDGLVYRFYNPISRGHFFTTNEVERDNVLLHGEWGYVYEKYGFQASEVGGGNLTPIYRFYNSNSLGHFFTASEEEKNTVLANPNWGYSFEGVGFYAYGSSVEGSKPVYRFYNSFSQGHFFTISEEEKNTVLANPNWGYSFEGVGFYANPVG